MSRWTVVYQGARREEVVQEGDVGSQALATFDKAATMGTLNGRAVTAMWITDESTEPEDVVRIYGRVGAEMHLRHARSRTRQS